MAVNHLLDHNAPDWAELWLNDETTLIGQHANPNQILGLNNHNEIQTLGTLSPGAILIGSTGAPVPGTITGVDGISVINTPGNIFISGAGVTGTAGSTGATGATGAQGAGAQLTNTVYTWTGTAGNISTVNFHVDSINNSLAQILTLPSVSNAIDFTITFQQEISQLYVNSNGSDTQAGTYYMPTGSGGIFSGTVHAVYSSFSPGDVIYYTSDTNIWSIFAATSTGSVFAV